MRLSSFRAPSVFCVSLALSLALTGCAGGGHSPGGGTQPPPPPAGEFLFDAAQGHVVSFSIDTSTGALTQTSVLTGNTGGYGICTNPAGTFLYADDGAAGGIDGFSISSAGGLTAISGSPFPMPTGWAPVTIDSLTADPSGKFLYVPDGASNEVAGFAIDNATGSLTPVSGSPFATGAEPAGVVVDPSGQFLYVSDSNDPLGGISAFTIDPSSGSLSPIPGSPFPTQVQGGPDGLAVAPSGKFLYAAMPYAGAIAAFTIDDTSGALTQMAGSPFTIDPTNPEVFTYSIAFTPSGNFLYAQGTMDGLLFGFSVDPNSGALTPTSDSPFDFGLVTFPSNLSADPSGEFLYVGGTAITVLSIDETTGAVASISGLADSGFSQGLTVVKVP